MKHEDVAVKDYCLKMKTQHVDFKCKKSGFCINSNYPYIGASPDAIISFKCCGTGVLEVKCPFCIKDQEILPLTSKSCLEQNCEQIRLKEKHAYMYQIQTQLLVCDYTYGDFVVWTNKDMVIDRIHPNHEMFAYMIEHSQSFFKKVILPELFSKKFSKQYIVSKKDVLRKDLQVPLHNVSDADLNNNNTNEHISASNPNIVSITAVSSETNCKVSDCICIVSSTLRRTPFLKPAPPFWMYPL